MSGSKVVDATDADAEGRSLGEEDSRCFIPLGRTSSRLGSFWFTFFFFFYVSGEGSFSWWENVGKEWD